MPDGIVQSLVASALGCGLVGLAAFPNASVAIAEAPASSAPIVAEYAASAESRDFRVTLLGVTRGVSFLQSPEPVGDVGRESGNHPVRWMRVAALVENLGDEEAGPNLRVETPDGAELVGKTPVDLNGRVVTMRFRGLAEMDLNYPLLAPHVFPIDLQNRSASRDAKVFVYTFSGDTRSSDAVTLRFRFGATDERQEIVFEGVPIP